MPELGPRLFGYSRADMARAWDKGSADTGGVNPYRDAPGTVWQEQCPHCDYAAAPRYMTAHLCDAHPEILERETRNKDDIQAAAGGRTRRPT